MTAGKNPARFLKRIIDKFNYLILLPINDHQYIQPYEIKQNMKKKLKIFALNVVLISAKQ